MTTDRTRPVLARLSNIVTVEESVPGMITFHRESTVNSSVAFITLDSRAEDTLLTLLLERKHQRENPTWQVVNARTGQVIAACLVAKNFGSALIAAQEHGFVDYDRYDDPVTAYRVNPNTYERLEA